MMAMDLSIGGKRFKIPDSWICTSVENQTKTDFKETKTDTKLQGAGNDLSDDYVEEELPRGGAGRSRARLLKKAEAHRFPPDLKKSIFTFK